jgi:hypothetical protein
MRPSRAGLERGVLNVFASSSGVFYDDICLTDGFTFDSPAEREAFLSVLERKYRVKISEADAGRLDVGTYNSKIGKSVFVPRDVIDYISTRVEFLG